MKKVILIQIASSMIVLFTSVAGLADCNAPVTVDERVKCTRGVVNFPNAQFNGKPLLGFTASENYSEAFDNVERQKALALKKASAICQVLQYGPAFSVSYKIQSTEAEAYNVVSGQFVGKVHTPSSVWLGGYRRSADFPAGGFYKNFNWAIIESFSCIANKQ